MMKRNFFSTVFFAAIFSLQNSYGQICMPTSGSQSVSTCSEPFYSSQCGAGYWVDESGMEILCPDVAGHYVSLTFVSLDFADANDILRIYSGIGISGTLLTTLSYGSAATSTPIISTVSNGCLT